MRAFSSFFGTVVEAARLPVRAAFCSSWDRSGAPIHDCDYFPYKWVTNRDDFAYELERKARNGITHVCFSAPNGEPYDGPGVFNVPSTPNWRRDDGTLDPDYIAMIRAALAIVPFGVFYCYPGGQGPNGAANIYNGNLRRMVRQLVAEGLAAKLIVLWGWETFGRNPECTAKQNSDAWQILWEELVVTGADGVIAEHVNSSEPQRATWASWPVEPDDPSGGSEPGAHYIGGGRFPGVFFGQLGLGIPRPGSYESRLIEILDRFLPQGTPIPSVGTGTFVRDVEDGKRDDTPAAIGPDWFGAPRPGGRMEYCMWEPGLAFVTIRKQCTQADVEKVARDMDGLGIRSQGCLPVGA